MDTPSSLESEVVNQAKKTICLNLQEKKAFHDRLITTITSEAQGTPVYRERVKKIDRVEDLKELPLNPYLAIHEGIKKYGLEKALLTKPAKYWQTSGYTGEPKRFYYSSNDVEAITTSFMLMGYLMGIRSWQSGWNFGGRDPLLSADLIALCAKKMGLNDLVTSPLGSQEDFFNGLRQASKRAHYDVMVGTPFLFLLTSRIARESGYARGLVADAIRSRIKLPMFLALLLSRYMVRGINYENLRKIVETVTIGLSYTEPIAPNIQKMTQEYPKMHFFDALGSTEMPVQAFQVSLNQEGLAYMLGEVIPEIVDPSEISKAKQDPAYRVKSKAWYEWTPGLRGELVITRYGECLSLIRYPTGDYIEVVDPLRNYNVKLENQNLEFSLPAIKVLGRSVDLVDFEVPDEKGDFIGGRIYTRQVNESLSDILNIRWWEMYRLQGSPGRLVFFIIPESEVANEAEFKAKINRGLEKADFFMSVAYTVKLVDVVIAKPNAYKAVQREIDKRVKEGRSLGQLKPKHIYSVDEKGLKEAYEKFEAVP